ncbi:transmembrane 4 L6 family member 19 isoform X1 [Pseudochaenichthys georgianus]|uniref:transmembrane 4 L6 family member 19 isoform X1 n=2 Tax=Pseudochaenichthys georgianus TaxID=52239 RepID=UPI00146C2E9F|nr:transmembrane 4 L6 family member 19-like isoform X1 [Pseudochaenichthys georgianus]
MHMCVSRFLRCVSFSLVPMAIVCMLCNVLLLFPDLKIHFLLEGHVTREATWAPGLWGSGVLVLLAARSFLRSSRTSGCFAFRRQMFSQVLFSGVCVLSAGFCSLVSATALSQGPLCLYNDTHILTWGVPLQPLPDRHSGYLYNRSLWSSVCVRPGGVVLWNVVLFGLMGGVSALQTLLCGLNVLNALLGLLLGAQVAV